MKKKYRSFEEAREFAKNLKLNSHKEWFDYSKSGKKPDDIPTDVARVYKDKGWKGTGDFLGTGTIATQQLIYRSFTDARKYARSLGLKYRKDWSELAKSGKLPKDIPAAPWRTYLKEDKRRKK